MRYLSLGEVVDLHQAVLDQSGGATGIRDLGMLESALAQPRATFGGTDLHPTLVRKAAALGFSLAMNHPFVDGNKRVAHAAMEVFLLLNGFEINAAVDEQERLMLDLAAGKVTREQLTVWLENHVKPAIR
ncbi:MAG: death-on-curing protein [Acidobacteria bacterium RIFCSPLOWO2_12_FULL_65_11]|nr:MAG: death-on-curing protein [Acidobacteria bacterium RIFCSPLOWO2_02_FULL_64_15]OFW28804.1 MAG: death-on-curing protein [Acidobacteria bacterium RIFCSPLOWO2_12_FULL_65_11]